MTLSWFNLNRTSKTLNLSFLLLFQQSGQENHDNNIAYVIILNSLFIIGYFGCCQTLSRALHWLVTSLINKKIEELFSLSQTLSLPYLLFIVIIFLLLLRYPVRLFCLKISQVGYVIDAEFNVTLIQSIGLQIEGDSSSLKESL